MPLLSPDVRTDITPLTAAVFMGSNGCEHQEFMQPIKVNHGPDEGTVSLQIGEAFVMFSSLSGLMDLLSRSEPTPVAIAG